jgi:hypothetical protein
MSTPGTKPQAASGQAPPFTSSLGLGAASSSDTWLPGLAQDWISSALGQQVDTALNDWFNQADSAADSTAGACGLICNGLICNGADGTGGGTLGWCPRRQLRGRRQTRRRRAPQAPAATAAVARSFTAPAASPAPPGLPLPRLARKPRLSPAAAHRPPRSPNPFSTRRLWWRPIQTMCRPPVRNRCVWALMPPTHGR